MKMEHIIECLLAIQEEMKASQDGCHEEEMIAKMKAEVKAIREKIEANQQKMDAWQKKMEASQEELETKMEACLEESGAN